MPNERKRPTPPTPLRPPQSPDDLHAWIAQNLGLHIPRQAMMQTHCSPFDYLCHGFFDPPPRGEEFAGEAARYRAPEPRDVVLWANRGGGKTFLGALATLLDLVFKPGIEVRILGGSIDQSRRMLAHLRRLFDAHDHPGLAAMVDGAVTSTGLKLRNGSEVQVLAQSQTSVRGTRVQIIRCDEAELFKRDILEAVQQVTRSKRCGLFDVRGRVECLSTMHRPFGVMHQLVKECELGARTLFRWGVLDVLETCGEEHRCGAAPGEEVSPGATDVCPLFEECQGRAKQVPAPGGHFHVSDAKVIKRRSSVPAWQAEMLCLRPRRTDTVLPEFDPSVHVGAWNLVAGRVAPRPGSPVQRGGIVSDMVCGMDFGFRCPTVILWVAHTREDDLYVLDELVQTERSIEQHALTILNGHPGASAERGEPPWGVPAWIGCDPSGQNHDPHGHTCAKALRDAGLTVRMRRLRVLEGVELIRARLRPADASPPRLYVHERCEKTIECLTRYHYPPDRPESQTPVKDGFDHPVDALRYLLYNLDRKTATGHGNYLHG